MQALNLHASRAAQLPAARCERGRAAPRSALPARPVSCALPPRRVRLVAAAGLPRAVSAAVSEPEVLKSYQRLQNGSDVRGVALPGVVGQDVTLSPDRCAATASSAPFVKRATHFSARCAALRSACFIAHAFVGWLAAKTGLPAAKLRVSVR